MQLKAQEVALLQRGERLEIDVPEVGGRCVVLRSDVLSKLLRNLTDDLPAEAVTELVDRAMSEDDAADPWLASYQACRQ